jgi:hypothetical protein
LPAVARGVAALRGKSQYGRRESLEEESEHSRPRPQRPSRSGLLASRTPGARITGSHAQPRSRRPPLASLRLGDAAATPRLSDARRSERLAEVERCGFILVVVPAETGPARDDGAARRRPRLSLSSALATPGRPGSGDAFAREQPRGSLCAVTARLEGPEGHRGGRHDRCAGPAPTSGRSDVTTATLALWHFPCSMNVFWRSSTR